MWSSFMLIYRLLVVLALVIVLVFESHNLPLLLDAFCLQGNTNKNASRPQTPEETKGLEY